MDYFTYNQGYDLMPENTFKISPSRLSRFFDDTSNWYRECLLGEAPVFTGSTASYLGTVVHGLAAMYMVEGKADFAKAEEFIESITNPDVDKTHIRQQYPVMYSTLQQQYLSTVKGTAEGFYFKEVLPLISVGGSIDLHTDEEIVDYKTTSDLNAPTKIKRAYWFQLMAYAWMMRLLGHKIKRIRIVYVTTHDVGRTSPTTGKPLKDYPCTVSSIVHEITDADIELIEGVLKLVAHSVKAWQENPEIRFLLAQDFRLKTKPKSIFSRQ